MMAQAQLLNICLTNVYPVKLIISEIVISFKLLKLFCWYLYQSEN